MHRILPCLLLACSVSAQVSSYAASLDGANQVPPVAAPGGGFATVRLEEPANSVRIFVHHFGLTGAPTAAHLISFAWVGWCCPVARRSVDPRTPLRALRDVHERRRWRAHWAAKAAPPRASALR